jgi:hypothetical protein
LFFQRKRCFILKYLNEEFNGRILWGSDSHPYVYLGKRGYIGGVGIIKQVLKEEVKFVELF